MAESMSLRHFPEYDPPTLTAKDRERERIAQDTARYLRDGGTIKRATSEDNRPFIVNFKRVQYLQYLKRDYRINPRRWNQINPD